MILAQVIYKIHLREPGNKRGKKIFSLLFSCLSMLFTF